ncbi:hypothetical protein LguiB_011553 [Lonicera macranthoides]
MRTIPKNRTKIDRISQLPDSILTLILSFVDTRTAVRTSALSKRWRIVWTSLPSLDFYYPKINPSFASFVYKVLSLRDSNSHLTSLKFSVTVDVDPFLVEQCVNYGFSHNLHDLRIRAFCTKRPVELPSISNSLRVLRLTNATATSIALPRWWKMPALKSLHLKNFAFSDQNYNGEIFSGCPALETLVLCKCSIRCKEDKLKVVNISGLQLRNLEILYWRCPWDHHFDQSIEVSTPGLASFKYKGLVSPVSFTEELHCIDKVCIDLWCPSSCGMVNMEERKLRTTEIVIGLLDKLCNLKALTLSLKTIEILGQLPDLQVCASTTFNNLRHLRFKADHTCSETNLDINTMTNILKSPDCERNLLLDLPEGKKRTSRKPVEFIEIPSNVLSYLLLSSPCAETLVVEFPEETDEQS